MTKLEITEKFTIEDIHKIREYNQEITKDMTILEKNDYYNKSSEDILKSFGISYKKNNSVLSDNSLEK